MIYKKRISGGVEDVSIDSTQIPDGSEFKKLFGLNGVPFAGTKLYDSEGNEYNPTVADTGVRFKVGTGELVFIKDDETGLTIPFYWDGIASHGANIVMGLEESGSTFKIRFTRRTKIDATPSTAGMAADVIQSIKNEYAAVETQPKFRAFYDYNRPKTTGLGTGAYIEALIPVTFKGKDCTIVVAPNYDDPKKQSMYFVEKTPAEVKRALVVDKTELVSDLGAKGIDGKIEDCGKKGINFYLRTATTKKGKTVIKSKLKYYAHYNGAEASIVVDFKKQVSEEFANNNVKLPKESWYTLNKPMGRPTRGKVKKGLAIAVCLAMLAGGTGLVCKLAIPEDIPTATITAQNKQAEDDAAKAAVASLPDATKQAREYGELQSIENAKKVGSTIGQQFGDGSWLEKQGDLLDYGFESFVQSGVTYQVSLLGSDGTYRTEEREVTEDVANAYGRTITYKDATADGYFNGAGKIVAQDAIDAGKPVAKKSGGEPEVLVTYDVSREAMVSKYGERLTKEYENGYVSHIKMQLEKGNVGANAIADAREFFMTEEEGQEIVKAIAGENAEVLSVKGGVAYFRSEDKSVVHRVEFEFNIDGGDGNYVFVANNKPFFRASDAFENVFPGKDASKYADMYVALNAKTAQGKTTAETETLTVVAGGDVKEEKTSVVTASSDNFDGDLATVYAVKGGNASTIKPGYTVDDPKAEKPAETSKTETATQGLGGK